MPRSTAGLLVDWLELLDPEMLAASPVLQQQLLFARQQRPRSQGMEPFYLIAIMITVKLKRYLGNSTENNAVIMTNEMCIKQRGKS